MFYRVLRSMRIGERVFTPKQVVQDGIPPHVLPLLLRTGFISEIEGPPIHIPTDVVRRRRGRPPREVVQGAA